MKEPPGSGADAGEILAWLVCVCDDLPVEQQNSAIRTNREALAPVLEEMVLDDAYLLRRPLAAENNGDSQGGEQAFLTILQPIRDRLIREYGISTAAEFLVIDALVLSYYQYIRAATALHGYTANGQSSNSEILVRYVQPYVAKANDLFLRNLQALREMKTSPITIKIEQAGQVNVGQRQLNVAQESSDPNTADSGEAESVQLLAERSQDQIE